MICLLCLAPVLIIMLLCHVITKRGENSEYTRCQDGH